MAKKVKGGQKLRAINILIADYFQMTASKLINRSSNIDEIGKLIDLITDVKRFISGKEEIDIRGAENLERDRISVVGSLTRLENNSIARFTSLEMAGAYNSRKVAIAEGLEHAPLAKKLRANIEKLLNEDKGFTFCEFLHGAGRYRVMKMEQNEYSVMLYSKKLDSWSERSIFKTERV